VLALAEGLGGEALDYGCGWGDLTAALAPQFRAIRGVDVSPERVAFAREEWAPIPFDVCQPDGLACADASFDVVFSIVVLHFTPDPVRYLQTCHRILRPGGTLVVMVQNPESMWMLGRRLRGHTPHELQLRATTRAGFRDVLRGHGFVVEREMGFYDPPFERVRTPGDVAISLLNAGGHLLRVPGHWSYIGFRCRRIP
jgi:ubiquinone/menaquinone biosynthesis C-methylase UbiE